MKRSYGNVSVASIELDVAAYEQVTKLSEELGINVK